MARTVTRAQIRDRARQLGNVVNDPNVTDAELNELINLHLTTVYDLLVSAGPPDYYAASTTVTTSPGVIVYPLLVDFLSLTAVHAMESSDLRRPVYPMERRDMFKAPSGAWSVELEYVPVCPKLNADGDTFDGVDGWEDIVSAKVALDVLAEREGDPGICMAMIEKQEKRIRSQSTQRDRGGLKMLRDVETEFAWPRTVRIDAYRLRAGNIELYEALWGWP